MKTVLIAEDNDINVLLLQRFLQKWNILHDRAADGMEVLEMMKQKAYSAILMDIQMPVLDGFETARIIKDQGHELPVLALTADANQSVIDRLGPPLFTGYIIKPIGFQELKQKMEVLLQLKL